MTATKPPHTPGPWRKARSHERLNSHDIGIACDGVQTVFAECYAEFWAKGDVRPSECEANANLIAAAPDLLAACEAVAPIIDGMADGLRHEPSQTLADSFIVSLQATLRAAISRARGETP